MSLKRRASANCFTLNSKLLLGLPGGKSCILLFSSNSLCCYSHCLVHGNSKILCSCLGSVAWDEKDKIQLAYSWTGSLPPHQASRPHRTHRNYEGPTERTPQRCGHQCWRLVGPLPSYRLGDKITTVELTTLLQNRLKYYLFSVQTKPLTLASPIYHLFHRMWSVGCWRQSCLPAAF